jgi:hypothetical protein
MESEVHLEPEPGTWASLAQEQREDVAWHGRRLSEWGALTRGELGLPEDRVIIATGHQAGFWHPGILAKFLAADAVVETIGRERACSLHLVVDQDDNNCVTIEVPIIDRAGVLYAVNEPIVRLPVDAAVTHKSSGSHLDRPTGEFPALEPVDAAGSLVSKEAAEKSRRPALDSIPDSLRRVEIALRKHRDARSLAQQMAEAVHDELSAWMEKPAFLCASRLLETSFGRAIVEKIARDPVAFAQSYNDAVGTGDGDVRPLERRHHDWELPLWRIDADRRRQPVFASEVPFFDSSSFRPRALLMTAIMRLVVCDFFIHGRGGFEYDRAMEKWIGDWLGLRVCPIALASADVRLPFPEVEVVNERDLQRMISAHRHLLHDPEMREDELSARKRQWLADINALPRHSRERRQRFIEYHRWLDQSRSEHEAALRASGERGVQMCRLFDSQETIRRRDWAFPLYPRAMLDALNHEIRARITRCSRVGIPAESPPARGA